MATLPQGGYLRLPLRLKRGNLVTCDLEESVRRFLQLNLNVPKQSKDRPAWMPADPNAGCDVPHFDFQAVSRALGGDTARLVSAIRKTAKEVEPRVETVEVEVRDVPKGDAARRKPDGTLFKGVMKRVVIACRRTDGGMQELHYDVAFGGVGPVFDGSQ